MMRFVSGASLQCEGVALPEQAINRGLEAYHRGRPSQASRHIFAAEPGASTGTPVPPR